MVMTTGRMSRRICLLFLILFTLEFSDLAQADESQGIKDPSDILVSVIHLLNLIESKLERHETRERALGDLLKRGQRNIEALIRGLEWRLSQIEIIFKEPEVNLEAPNYEYNKRLVSPSRYHMTVADRKILLRQQIPASQGLIKETADNKPEIRELLTQISANIEILLDTSRQLTAQTMCKQQSEHMEQLPASIVVEKAGDNNTNISKQIMQISTNVEHLIDTSSYIMQQTSAIKDPPVPTINNEFENKLLMKFDELAAGVQELRVQDKNKKEYTLANADRDLIYGLTNDTLNAIENTKTILKNNTDRVFTDLTTIIKLTAETHRLDADRILKDINRHTYWLGSIYEIISANSENSNKSVEVLCKSRTELQNNTEIGYSKEFIDLLNKQRDEIVNKLVMYLKELDNSFNRTQTEGMHNLNSTIKNEISYIWRQISITNGDITNTAELLRQIRSRSEVFVNSVLQSMVSIGDKIDDIKGSMSDIHTNQDYLLDNLNLLTQNFDVNNEKVSSNTQK